MRTRLSTAVLVLSALAAPFAAPDRLAAQDGSPRAAGPSVGLFGGLGSGPIDAATVGVDLRLPVWTIFSLRVELSGWGNGLGGTMCLATLPESHRCSVSGRAMLVGLAAAARVDGRLGVYGDVAGGRFIRDWLEDRTIGSGALSVEAGARVWLTAGAFARLGVRHLRAFDDHYEALLDEKLQYTMGIVALEYAWSW